MKIQAMNTTTLKTKPPTIIRTQSSIGTSIHQPSQNTPADASPMGTIQR